MKKILILLIIFTGCITVEAQKKKKENVVIMNANSYRSTTLAGGVQSWDNVPDYKVDIQVSIDYNKKRNNIKFSNDKKYKLHLFIFVKKDRSQDKDGNWTTRYFYDSIDSNSRDLRIVIRYWDISKKMQLYLFYNNFASVYSGNRT